MIKMNYEKTDRLGLYRDRSNGAIVNRDIKSLEAYKKRKEKAKEFEDLKRKQDHIENELLEIKGLLRQALEKVNNG